MPCKPNELIRAHFSCYSCRFRYYIPIKVKSSMARSLPVENLLPQNVGQLSTTCRNVLKRPNGELLVAGNHNQLRTMASETVDPIDWSHPPLSLAVPPERHVHGINQCNLSWTRTCNRSMQGNHLAYAATQGIILCKFNRSCITITENYPVYMGPCGNKIVS